VTRPRPRERRMVCCLGTRVVSGTLDEMHCYFEPPPGASFGAARYHGFAQEPETLTTRQQKAQTPLSRAAVRTFAANERMNQLVIENLDPAAWNAKLAAKPSGQVRTIAAIFTH